MYGAASRLSTQGNGPARITAPRSGLRSPYADVPAWRGGGSLVRSAWTALPLRRGVRYMYETTVGRESPAAGNGAPRVELRLAGAEETPFNIVYEVRP
jgi:hypothetical protein